MKHCLLSLGSGLVALCALGCTGPETEPVDNGEISPTQIRGYSWAGTPTEDFEGTTRFFREVLGLPVLRHDETRKFAAFRLPSGQLFEVFGPGNPDHELMTAPAIAFDVEDVEQARAELEAKGVRFVTEIVRGGGNAWCYFEGPDKFLYEVWQRGSESE